MTKNQPQTSIALNNAPTFILVQPQMGENIGASARAMLNCGVPNLSIVNPRDGWPNIQAERSASGAFDIMPEIISYEDTSSALAKSNYVYATTARKRDLVKPVMSPRHAVNDMREKIKQGSQVAVLFGGERAGLSNEDITLTNVLIHIPTNPDFSSLNLSQAVLCIAYEWLNSAQENTEDIHLPTGKSQLAEHSELIELYERLENELETHHFFREQALKPTLIQNIRSFLNRATLTSQEVKTFHGMITCLTGKKTLRK